VDVLMISVLDQIIGSEERGRQRLNDRFRNLLKSADK